MKQMKKSVLGVVPTALAAAAMTGASAYALPIQVVFSIKPVTDGHPKAAVPGYPGAQFTNIGAVYRSHQTNLWIAIPTTDMTPTTADQVLAIGNGGTITVTAREGVTEFAPGQTLDFSTNIPVPRVNDAGQWAMGFRPTGLATGDERVVKFDGTNYSVIAQSFTPSPHFDGVNWLSGMNSAAITNAGAVSFISGINDVTVTKGVFTNNGNDREAAIFETVPAGQDAGGTAVLDQIDNGSYTQSADGAARMYIGRLQGGGKVAVLNGTVKVQVGVALEGMASPVSSISDAFVESNGNWYARGSNSDGQGWAVKNGIVIASTGSPIFIGASENWSSLTDLKGNNKGDFAILGNVSGAATNVNSAIVLNGRKQIARRSDGVDLDGNGVADESLYAGIFRGGRCFLGNDGWFYIGTSLKAAFEGTTLISANSAFLRIDATYCIADLDDGTGSGRIDNGVDVNDLLYFLAGFEAGSRLVDIDDGSATGTRDGGIDINDLLYFLARFEAGC